VTLAFFSAASRLPVEVRKKFMTSSSANDGELETSTTTFAPTRTSASPSPVRVFTPESGEAGTASCPCAFSFATTFEPISPVPPMTTAFMSVPFLGGMVLAPGMTGQARSL
jgi:hypothetical protein